MSKINIGTSGWMYEHWKGVFYPGEISQEKILPFYSRSFDTVEINNTFYQLPSKESVEKWKKEVPENFIFSVKASRYITHIKNLKGVEEALENFISRIERLEEKLGPILFQLPPHRQANLPRLEDFLKALSNNHRYVFEFRHPSWYKKELFEMLEKYRTALCIHDHFQGSVLPRLTTDFAYVRLHGPKGDYGSIYSKNQLVGWTEQFKKWQKEKTNIFCYFNNDAEGYAVKNGLQLKDILK